MWDETNKRGRRVVEVMGERWSMWRLLLPFCFRTFMSERRDLGGKHVEVGNTRMVAYFCFLEPLLLSCHQPFVSSTNSQAAPTTAFCPFLAPIPSPLPCTSLSAPLPCLFLPLPILSISPNLSWFLLPPYFVTLPARLPFTSLSLPSPVSLLAPSLYSTLPPWLPLPLQCFLFYLTVPLFHCPFLPSLSSFLPALPHFPSIPTFPFLSPSPPRLILPFPVLFLFPAWPLKYFNYQSCCPSEHEVVSVVLLLLLLAWWWRCEGDDGDSDSGEDSGGDGGGSCIGSGSCGDGGSDAFFNIVVALVYWLTIFLNYRQVINLCRQWKVSWDI